MPKKAHEYRLDIVEVETGNPIDDVSFHFGGDCDEEDCEFFHPGAPSAIDELHALDFVADILQKIDIYQAARRRDVP